MELIYYDKAAEILGVTIGTLAHAVSRGELTRVGMEGTRQRLIKEQVMLFTGINPRTGNKKRISYDALSEGEQTQWHRYTNDLKTTQASYTSYPTPEDIREEVRKELARQQQALLQEQKREIERKEEGLIKENPFLPNGEGDSVATSDIIEFAGKLPPLDSDSLSMLLGVVILLFGLFFLSSVSRITNISTNIIEEAKLKTREPHIVQLAEKIKSKAKHPREAMKLMIDEARKHAA